MPKKTIPLSDTKIRTAKPTEKPYKLSDTDGLYLLVTENGGKWWRFKYRFEGKEKLLSFGTYPEISLAEARVPRDEARTQIARGIDPGALRKAQKQAATEEKETFGVIAREWYAKFVSNWSPGHAKAIKNRMENLIPLGGPIIEQSISLNDRR